MFIIRALFWLTVVLLLIPGGGGKDSASFTSGGADALHPGAPNAGDAATRSVPAAHAAGKA